MIAELRGLVKELMLEEPIETIENRKAIFKEVVKQNRIEGAVGNPAPDEQESQDLLVPVSLMVLGIGGRNNESESNQTVSETLQSTNEHSVEQVKPSFDQTTGYPRHDFEQ